jgi:hypothetical protein
MLYAKYEYIKELEKEQEALREIVESGCRKTVFRRNRSGKIFYYEVTFRNGKRTQKSIPDKQLGEKHYRQYAQYRFAKEQLKQIRNELSSLQTDSEALRQQLIAEYKIIQALPEGPRSEQNFRTEGLIYETLRGEKVRSKSEAIIADALYRHGISYQYEKVLKKDGITRVDFTIENNIRGQTMYWEHFGKMGEPDYVLEYLKKKKRYENMGIIEGKNLIATYEFYGSGKPSLPFDARQAEAAILKYLDVPPGGV